MPLHQLPPDRDGGRLLRVLLGGARGVGVGVTPRRKAHNSRPGRSSSQLCRPTTRARIYLRDGHRCVWCAQRVGCARLGMPNDATLDHVIPRAEGGSNRYWNLVTSCQRCNSRRRHESAVTFAERFGYDAPAIAWRILAAISKPLPALPGQPVRVVLP